MRLGLASVSTLCVLLAPRVVGALAPAAARPRVITDVIHRSITLHPLCVQIVDTPEFQRLRGISQLGTVQWVFPCARHDRFQHALGVSHLASEWARQFQREQPELHISDQARYLVITPSVEEQPELHISDQEVLCVTVAGLVHDLGHGPFSHFWEGSFLPAVAAADPSTRASMPPKHEEISNPSPDANPNPSPNPNPTPAPNQARGDLMPAARPAAGGHRPVALAGGTAAHGADQGPGARRARRLRAREVLPLRHRGQPALGPRRGQDRLLSAGLVLLWSDQGLF